MKESKDEKCKSCCLPGRWILGTGRGRWGTQTRPESLLFDLAAPCRRLRLRRRAALVDSSTDNGGGCAYGTVGVDDEEDAVGVAALAEVAGEEVAAGRTGFALGPCQ